MRASAWPAAVLPLVSWRWDIIPSAAAVADYCSRLRHLNYGGCVVTASSQLLLSQRDEWNRAGRGLSRELEEWWLRPNLDAPAECDKRIVRCHDWLNEKGRWRKRKLPDRVIAAYAVEQDDAAASFDVERALDVTEAVQSRLQPRGLRTGARYRVLAFTEATLSGAVSPCDSRAWNGWMRPALEPVVDALDDSARGHLRGLWLEALTPLPADDEAALPRLEDSGEDFSYGSVGRALLPMLSARTTMDAVSLRLRFWERVRELQKERFYEPLQEWTSSRDLALTLSIRPTSLLDLALLPSGCGFAVPLDVRQPLSGLRMIAAARGASCARASHSTLAAFSSSLTDLTMRERKTLLELCALAEGVRPALTDLDDLSIAEWPQTSLLRASLQEWQAPSLQSRYGARVALLFPRTSILAHSAGDDPLRRCLADDFEYCARLLFLHKFEFVIADEESLLRATIDSGTLVCDDFRCELLVLPSVTTLSSECWERVEEFIAHGGRVAALALLPREDRAGRNAALARRVTITARIDLPTVYETYEQSVDNDGVELDSFPVFREDRSGGRFCTFQARLSPDQDDAALRVHQILRESLTADFEALAPSLRCARRESSEGTSRYHIVNTGDEWTRTTLRLRGAGHVLRLDARDNTWRDCLVYALLSEEVLAVPAEFAPRESLLLTIQSPPRPHVETANFTVTSFAITPAGFLVQGYALRRGQALAEVAEFIATRALDADQALLQIMAEGPPLQERRWRGSVAVKFDPLLIELASRPRRHAARGFGNLLRARQRATADRTALIAEIEWAPLPDRRNFIEVIASEPTNDDRAWLECVVNDQVAGRRLFPPFAFEVTERLRSGRNRIELRVPCGSSLSLAARVAAYPIVEIRIAR